MEHFLTWISENWLVVLTSCVTVCSVIAKVTPNETDNKIVHALQQVVDALALSSTPTQYTGDKLKLLKGGFVRFPVLLVVVFAALLVLVGGCGVKDLAPADQAMALSDEVTTAYLSVRDEYLNLIEELPAGKAGQLREIVAPILDEGRDALVLLRDAVSVWKSSEEKPDNFDALMSRVWVLIDDAWAKIGQVRGEEV